MATTNQWFSQLDSQKVEQLIETGRSMGLIDGQPVVEVTVDEAWQPKQEGDYRWKMRIVSLTEKDVRALVALRAQQIHAGTPQIKADHPVRPKIGDMLILPDGQRVHFTFVGDQAAEYKNGDTTNRVLEENLAHAHDGEPNTWVLVNYSHAKPETAP
jgi:hypothetical protein